MPTGKRKPKDETLSKKPYQVKFPAWQEEEIEAAAKVTGKSKGEIIRLAAEAGMEYLNEIGWKVGKAAYHHAKREREKL